MKKYFIILSGIILILSCNQNKQQSEIKQGKWRAVLAIDENDSSTVIPFHFELAGTYPESLKIHILNADERIPVEDIQIYDDSIFIQLPVFDSEIRALIKDDTLSGNWYNYAKSDDYSIPFKAVNFSFCVTPCQGVQNCPFVTIGFKHGVFKYVYLGEYIFAV